MWKTVRAKKSMQLVTHPKKRNKWYIHGFQRESPPDKTWKNKEALLAAQCILPTKKSLNDQIIASLK